MLRKGVVWSPACAAVLTPGSLLPLKPNMKWHQRSLTTGDSLQSTSSEFASFFHSVKLGRGLKLDKLLLAGFTTQILFENFDGL